MSDDANAGIETGNCSVNEPSTNPTPDPNKTFDEGIARLEETLRIVSAEDAIPEGPEIEF